ncbi:MAG: lysophospholipid acyltransferase family protein [Candidatus Tectomicrobia bacterium]|uniref:Lysophospholipid acyltransferase family protein n=1 Tax=Tectimicrobiota bacterium TaxID=2528274 RepID=A0A932M1B7_UNCTE|nr:lysophospholipid acyltransferase family protein [Candidatus Tectomicrobia bacterium]
MKWQRTLQFLIPRLGIPLLWALYKSLRIEVRNSEAEERLRAGGRPFIYAIWHGRMLCPILSRSHRQICTLVSLSRDGEIINAFLQRLGFRTVRGSSSRGGARGLTALVREVKAGHDVAITPDGPRGPRFQAQEGALDLAARTGAPLLLTTSAARRAFVCKSWDRFLIPLPFSRVVIQFGGLLRVTPEDLRQRGQETRLLLEEGLNRITEEVDALCRG